MRPPIPFRSSLRYALSGILRGYLTQRNLRVQVACGVVVGIATCLLALPPLEIALIVWSVVAVVAAELFNTAIEATVDLVTPTPHPLAKIAKDVAAGAVLVVASGAALVGVLLLGSKLYPLALRPGGWRWALALAFAAGTARLLLPVVLGRQAHIEQEEAPPPAGAD